MSTFTQPNKHSATYDYPYKSGTGRTWDEMTDTWDLTLETWDELSTIAWSLQTVAQTIGLWDASVLPWQLALPWQHVGVGDPVFTNLNKS